jgi:hypothetical protein
MMVNDAGVAWTYISNFLSYVHTRAYIRQLFTRRHPKAGDVVTEHKIERGKSL